MLQMPGQHSAALAESFPGTISKLLAIAFAVSVIWSALDRPDSPLRSGLKTPAAFYLDILTSWQRWSTGLTTTNLQHIRILSTNHHSMYWFISAAWTWRMVWFWVDFVNLSFTPPQIVRGLPKMVKMLMVLFRMSIHTLLPHVPPIFSSCHLYYSRISLI